MKASGWETIGELVVKYRGTTDQLQRELPGCYRGTRGSKM